MSALQEFENLPPMHHLSLLLQRKPGLAPGGAIPRIEALARRCPPVTLGAYQRVCGWPADPHLPLTYPQVLATPLHMALLAHPLFPLKPLGLVHVSNRFSQTRPIRADEPFQLRSFAEGYRLVRKGLELTVHTQLECGEEVPWRSELTALLLSKVHRDESAASPSEPEPLPAQRSCIWSVPEDQGRRYAQVSGDRNPIHLRAWMAKLFGFKRAIVHGMWTLARALAELDLQSGPLDLEVAFRRPVFLPSRAWFRAGAHPQGGQFFRVDDPRGEKLLLHGRLHPQDGP